MNWSLKRRPTNVSTFKNFQAPIHIRNQPVSQTSTSLHIHMHKIQPEHTRIRGEFNYFQPHISLHGSIKSRSSWDSQRVLGTISSVLLHSEELRPSEFISKLPCPSPSLSAQLKATVQMMWSGVEMYLCASLRRGAQHVCRGQIRPAISRATNTRTSTTTTRGRREKAATVKERDFPH